MFNLADPSKYILLAEDNSADVELVREALEDRAIAYELHVVEDGERAIDYIARIDCDSNLHCPKLFLLDLHLPKRDGEEVLRCLRASGRCGQTPVVILTSSNSPIDRETATRNAAIHYFRKPNTLEQYLQLGDVVKDILALNTGARTAEIAS